MQVEAVILRQCWFLAGPTACGKTETGLHLAEDLKAEIISMDSMSLYRGLEIGTAKPSPEQRQRVPHHLVDILEPHEEFSLADYVAAAERACRDILDRSRIPLFVGGTGLYLRGLLRGVFDGPPADWALRRRLETEEARHEPGFLHRQLQEVDPGAARNLHPNDLRRVIRALEVYALTGEPLSQQQRQQPLPLGQRPENVYWLVPPRRWLYRQIEQRVEEMIEAGLLEEVRALLGRDRPLSRTARQALGYKELIEALNHATHLETAVEQIKGRTRRFAKRQHTWFRNLEECRPIEVPTDEEPRQWAERILQAAEDRQR